MQTTAKGSLGRIDEKTSRSKLMAWLLEVPEELKALSEAQRKAMWREVERAVPEVRATRKITRTAIASNAATRRSYSKLCARGLRSMEQFELLIGFAVSIREGGRVGRPLDWRVGLGKSWKSLAAFPKRLEHIAAEIQRLNQHELIRPDVWMKNRKLPKFIGESFSNLHLLLRCYADYLRSQFDFLNRSMRSPHGQVLDILLELVRNETRRAMYPEISEILTTTAAESGSPVETDFSPDSLKIRWQRNTGAA